MDTNRFVYFGNPDRHKPWIFKPHLYEEIQKTIDDGYTAISSMQFSSEVLDGNPEPVRYGPLLMDFDSHDGPIPAVNAAAQFMDKLNLYFGVDPNQCKYWLSGSKGCHVEIPAEIFGGEAGSVLLPYIHKTMLNLILNEMRVKMGASESLEAADYIDMQMYCGGKGKLVRLPNILRPNGRYKVQVDWHTLRNCTAEMYDLLTRQPDNSLITTAPPVKSENLARIFDMLRGLGTDRLSDERKQQALEMMLKCDFIRYCIENQEDTKEPWWWAFISNLVKLGKGARELIHEYSCKHPLYTYEETERKINEAIHADIPKTCEYIKNSLQFPCNKNCGVNCPCNLWHVAPLAPVLKEDNFSLEEDGVYYISKEGNKILLCSWLKVKGNLRDTDGFSWSVLVELRSLDGKVKELILEKKKMTGRCEEILGKLCDAGLQLGILSRASSLLMDYINIYSRKAGMAILTDKAGWLTDSCYVLPDMAFGVSSDAVYFRSMANTLHKCSGDLEEWKSNVGNLCEDNSLAEFLTSFALCGPLLRPLGMEGIGMHIYGCSSKGKTTLAMVAGSICGGGSSKGYMLQWRTTDNALENVAVRYNDNMLGLDEVSEADGFSIGKSIYMLANGQSKLRMKSDATLRKTSTWIVNVLSTGEITISDKIEENGRNVALAGQEVRIVNLPVDGEGGNPFINLHGVDSPGKLSDLLKANATTYYGTPLRSFLEKFCSAIGENVERVKTMMEGYYLNWLPDGACSQIQRVLKKFALIGAVGELAIEWGILPYPRGNVARAAKKWFGIWVKERKGLENQEIQKALERIRTHFETKAHLYVDAQQFADSSSLPTRELIGIQFDKRNGSFPIRCYLALSSTVKSLFGNCNRAEMLEKLKELRWIAYGENGRIPETYSINGRNYRGIPFILNNIL